MSITVAPPVRTATRYRWGVETLERGGGVAQTHRDAGCLRLRVSDPGDPSATEALLSDDGTVTVRSHCSPPALLVTACGARLIPATPDTEDTAELQQGDVLLLCSSGVLDGVPTGLGQILGWSPRRVANHEPRALLEHLMTGADRGATAVVRCTDEHITARGRIEEDD